MMLRIRPPSSAPAGTPAAPVDPARPDTCARRRPRPGIGVDLARPFAVTDPATRHRSAPWTDCPCVAISQADRRRASPPAAPHCRSRSVVNGKKYGFAQPRRPPGYGTAIFRTPLSCGRNVACPHRCAVGIAAPPRDRTHPRRRASASPTRSVDGDRRCSSGTQIEVGAHQIIDVDLHRDRQRRTPPGFPLAPVSVVSGA